MQVDLGPQNKWRDRTVFEK